MAGFVTGMCRLGIHFAYATPQCGNPDPDERPAIFTDVHYLHFAMILSVIVFFVTVCVSFVTAPRTEKQVNHLTCFSNSALKCQKKYILPQNYRKQSSDIPRCAPLSKNSSRENLLYSYWLSCAIYTFNFWHSKQAVVYLLFWNWICSCTE